MSKGKKENSITSAVLVLLIGPLLWAVHFTLVYGYQSAFCAISNQGNGEGSSTAVVVAIVVMTACAAFGLAAALYWPVTLTRWLRYHPRSKATWLFSVRVTRLLILISLAGVLWGGAAALVIDTCAHFR
ncbi:hypothetical protein [Phyllobacterium sp. K27]